MYKVLQKTDSQIYVGNDKGDLVKIDRSSQVCDVEVGDYVEIYKDKETTIITPVHVKNKINKNNFLKKIIPINQVITKLSIIIFAVCLIGLIIICSVPHGKKYKAENINGYDVSVTCYFDDNIITIATLSEDEEEITTYRYKMVENKVYTYDVESEEYSYFGKVSSTKLIVGNAGLRIVLKEKTLSTLKTLSIVFMSISGVLMIAGITLIILNKKGIIKIEKENENDIIIESDNS